MKNNNKISKRHHTGVGVLLITNYNNEPYILLGQESWKTLDYTSIAPGIKLPIYEEFGGGIQTKKVSLEKNATFELREETANLFNIRNSQLLEECPYFDIPFRHDRMYRIYLVYIENIYDYIKYFYINTNIIKNNKINNTNLINVKDKSVNYLEMLNIKLISLNEISKSCYDKANYICFNAIDTINNNSTTNKCYKGILRVNSDVYINSRLIEFLNSKYNGITGLTHIYNLYKKSVISSMFNNNTNLKIICIQRHYNHNNPQYDFLKGTWCLNIAI